jgi:hypothetical protein
MTTKGVEKIQASKEVTSVVIGPGAGEYIYDVDKSNVEDTIAKLQQDYPNLTKVSLVVGWFGDTTDAGKINIEPKVESKAGADWKVGDQTRDTASKITVDAKGNLNWGGTPTDESIVEFCSHLKEKGIDVVLYPMLFIDAEGKPWRGDIEAKSDADVAHFFQEYDAFIKHYAGLEHNGVQLKEVISDFIIGSEFQKLTSYHNSAYEFKAVTEFKELAADVRSIVGNDVKLTYAANWSEYHHTEGGWYHMDPLWSDPNIDYIGLDAYFRITNDHTSQKVTSEAVKAGWGSGIDYDYYLKGDTYMPLDERYATKNFEWFWKNTHVNPDGKETDWQPKMKPIVFTEAGFTAVDKTTNEPFKYSDPTTKGADLPVGSQGTIDPKIQYDAVVGTIQFLNELATNPDNEGMIAEITWYNVDPKGQGSDWAHNHELKLAEYEKGVFDSPEHQDQSQTAQNPIINPADNDS